MEASAKIGCAALLALFLGGCVDWEMGSREALAEVTWHSKGAKVVLFDPGLLDDFSTEVYVHGLAGNQENQKEHLVFKVEGRANLSAHFSDKGELIIAGRHYGDIWFQTTYAFGPIIYELEKYESPKRPKSEDEPTP